MARCMYIAVANSGVVIDSQTLTEGGMVTVAGTPIPYASDSGDVVVGTSTEGVGYWGLDYEWVWWWWGEYDDGACAIYGWCDEVWGGGVVCLGVWGGFWGVGGGGTR